METFSRRRFLQLIGVTVIGSQLRFPVRGAPEAVYQGRALTAASMYVKPHLASVVSGHLWPDSIMPILNVQKDWYQIQGGYVRREQLQPMTLFQPQLEISAPRGLFWAEVAGPVAVVRQNCAANAPLVTRIGHGGISHVIDFLPGEPNGWYGIADETGDLLGWSQAVQWRVVEDEVSFSGENTLHLDLRGHRLTAWENGKPILSAPCSTGIRAKPGIYPVQGRQIGSAQWEMGEERPIYHGLPWLIRFGEGEVLAGVYWHNRFGSSMAGPAAQVSPPLARWLYRWLNEGSQIIIE